jgi:hypothetical protein
VIFIVTGKLGAGKSLLAVQRAIDYALEGRRVATNFHIDFSRICIKSTTHLAKCPVTVLPSIPTYNDLMLLGQGGEFEDTAGALILDECAQFLNSRNWQGPEREKIINWLLHARKRRWDVFLIIQHERMLDKQIRDALAEYVVTIKRTDRMSVPFLPIKLPRMHVGVVRYGLDGNAPVADRWFTRGTLPMQCYDTTQIFEDEQPAYTVLPAIYTKFRNAPPKKSLWAKLTERVRGASAPAPVRQPPEFIQRLRLLNADVAMAYYRQYERHRLIEPQTGTHFPV